MLADRTVTDLYLRVQHFYARQMQAVDEGRFAEYADTFAEDGTFQHSPNVEPARGRAAILQSLIDYDERFTGEPVQRRHWFNQIVLDEQPDGSFRSTVYALVVATKPGTRLPFEIAPACIVHDVLEVSGDVILTRSRLVTYDYLG
jgi:actinorhodin biosynthesis protein ActVIA